MVAKNDQAHESLAKQLKEKHRYANTLPWSVVHPSAGHPKEIH